MSKPKQKKVLKFAVGQSVQYVGHFYSSVKGMTGKIVSIYHGQTSYPYRVVFQKYEQKWKARGATPSEFFCAENELAPATCATSWMHEKI